MYSVSYMLATRNQSLREMMLNHQSLHEMMLFWVLGISQNFPQRVAGESLKSKL